ncbi:hypothetical protein RJ639_032619 [Escallonia herrerae]|uniref:F-box domain-containing protein n=1 Tax=Escallonia herrerae TaxID=1293975 RepID=A0AA89BFZ2_9ASTE|nr:hypothetical protein RJ639_032619 [Escallonia herrerae]
MGNITGKLSGYSNQNSVQCLDEPDETVGNKKNESGSGVGIQLIIPPYNLKKQGAAQIFVRILRCLPLEVFQKKVTQPLPREVIAEILSWLPVKVLLRLQLVCKEWYAIIRDRYFIDKHISRATCATSFNVLRTTTVSPTSSSAQHEVHLICGCDGLVLERSNMKKKYHIANPTIRRTLELPDPHEDSLGMTFSFIPATGDYKLVSIYTDEHRHVCFEVLSVETDSSWRPLKFPEIENLDKRRKKCFLVPTDAAVHYVRVTRTGSDIEEVVASLDLETETFTVTYLPKGLYPDWDKVWAVSWKGKLAFLDRAREDLCVMVLEDYRKQKWGKRYTIISSAFKGIDEDDYIPLSAEYDHLWFWSKTKKIFSCNIETEDIRDVISAPDGTPIERMVTNNENIKVSTHSADVLEELSSEVLEWLLFILGLCGDDGVKVIAEVLCPKAEIILDIWPSLLVNQISGAPLLSINILDSKS